MQVAIHVSYMVWLQCDVKDAPSLKLTANFKKMVARGDNPASFWGNQPISPIFRGFGC